ncbi:low-density lipoprotein receptor-related protein 8 [Salminus brasiliensis]|uniref:low-density lipoprotein receptor-related protein 8 n=1 Tax=Salminus brasiliensis TaxID=930266 RepID=UPI003B82F5ED
MELLKSSMLLCAGLLLLHSAAAARAVSCSGSEFSCSDGQCVPNSGKCDHSPDCRDGSDEENCDENECEVNNGGCSHVCLDLQLGFVCDCPSGMRLVQDTHCEEVDPCLDADVCDQLCVQSNSSFTCECVDGYLRSPESGRCLATGGAAAGVVFSSSSGISWMNTNGSDQKTISESTGSPGPLAALMANSTLYWSNPEHAGVYRLFLAEEDQIPKLLFEETRGIVGLAVDWVHQVLYWTSNITQALHASPLNGSEHTPLVTGLTQPTAVAVHPLLRLLFWADSGVPPRIERSSLDGTDRKALITSIIHNPVSICVDIPRGLLYWADSGLHAISRVRYDGQQRKTVVESNGYLDEPFGLSIFEDRVYWSDRLTGSICSADKHNGKSLKVTQNARTRSPAGLFIYHPLLQDTGAVLSPDKVQDADSAFPWILSLIVFLCVVLAVLLSCWWRTQTSSSYSLTDFGDATLKESQDPLVPSTCSDAHPDKDGVHTDLAV